MKTFLVENKIEENKLIKAIWTLAMLQVGEGSGLDRRVVRKTGGLIYK